MISAYLVMLPGCGGGGAPTLPEESISDADQDGVADEEDPDSTDPKLPLPDINIKLNFNSTTNLSSVPLNIYREGSIVYYRLTNVKAFDWINDDGIYTYKADFAVDDSSFYFIDSAGNTTNITDLPASFDWNLHEQAYVSSDQYIKYFDLANIRRVHGKFFGSVVLVYDKNNHDMYLEFIKTLGSAAKSLIGKQNISADDFINAVKNNINIAQLAQLMKNIDHYMPYSAQLFTAFVNTNINLPIYIEYNKSWQCVGKQNFYKISISDLGEFNADGWDIANKFKWVLYTIKIRNGIDLYDLSSIQRPNDYDIIKREANMPGNDGVLGYVNTSGTLCVTPVEDMVSTSTFTAINILHGYVENAMLGTTNIPRVDFVSIFKVYPEKMRYTSTPINQGLVRPGETITIDVSNPGSEFKVTATNVPGTTVGISTVGSAKRVTIKVPSNPGTFYKLEVDIHDNYNGFPRGERLLFFYYISKLEHLSILSSITRGHHENRNGNIRTLLFVQQ